MKLLRWPLAGVTAYVIYKYAIGKKAKGEKVFDSPESGEEDVAPKAPAKAPKPKAPSAPKAPKPKAASAPRARKPKVPPAE